jgi:hypothetical protein
LDKTLIPDFNSFLGFIINRWAYSLVVSSLLFVNSRQPSFKMRLDFNTLVCVVVKIILFVEIHILS